MDEIEDSSMINLKITYSSNVKNEEWKKMMTKMLA